MLTTATLARRLTAIRQAHQLANRPLNTQHAIIKETWKGIRNTHGTNQNVKQPLLTEDVREMVALLSNKLIDLRDKALMLLGFAGAFRRSELVGLDIEDLSFGKEGLTVRIQRSKTDQEARGREVGIPYGSNPMTCPIRAAQDWLAALGITAGALFRGINRHGQLQSSRLSDRAVALIVKKVVYARARADGLNEELSNHYAAQFAGHSLRAGFATSAAKAGVAEHSIMRQTGHKKADTLRKYIRLGTLFTDNAAAKVGL
jgi:integrase